jgi:hypothetical protein
MVAETPEGGGGGPGGSENFGKGFIVFGSNSTGESFRSVLNFIFISKCVYEACSRESEAFSLPL